MSANELDFSDLQPVEFPVKVGDQGFVLREASGDAAAKYHNASVQTMLFDSKGNVVGMKNVGELESLLVSLCLFDLKGKPVPKAIILGFPNRVLRACFNKAKEISNLRETSKEHKLLEEALTMEGSPTSPETLKEFINSLEDEKFKPLKLWYKASAEESAKN